MPARQSSSGGMERRVKNAASAASPVTRYSTQVLVVSLTSAQTVVRQVACLAARRDPLPRRREGRSGADRVVSPAACTGPTLSGPDRSAALPGRGRGTGGARTPRGHARGRGKEEDAGHCRRERRERSSISPSETMRSKIRTLVDREPCSVRISCHAERRNHPSRSTARRSPSRVQRHLSGDLSPTPPPPTAPGATSPPSPPKRMRRRPPGRRECSPGPEKTAGHSSFAESSTPRDQPGVRATCPEGLHHGHHPRDRRAHGRERPRAPPRRGSQGDPSPRRGPVGHGPLHPLERQRAVQEG